MIKQFILFLYAVWTGSLVHAMRLPMVHPIEGYQKCDEFLFRAREALKNSPFHVYLGPKSGPIKIRELISLRDSTYVFGVTPRLYCSTSQFLVLNKYFLDKMAKEGQAKEAKSSNKAKRENKKSRRKQILKKQKPEEEPLLPVPVKILSIVIDQADLTRAYGSHVAIISQLDDDTVNGFIGFSVESLGNGFHMFRVFFSSDIAENPLADRMKAIFNCTQEPEFKDDQVFLDPSPPKTLRYNWELRNHLTGKLLITFHNKVLLQQYLEWTRAENLWDLILVRQGEFENLRGDPVLIGCGLYYKYDFHQVVTEHLEMIELKTFYSANHPLSSGFEEVMAMYFFQDPKLPEDMAVSYVLKAPSSSSETSEDLKKLLVKESFCLAKEHFIAKYLIHEKRNLETFPAVELRTSINSKVKTRNLIRAATDILAVLASAGTGTVKKLRSGEQMGFVFPLEEVDPNSPPLKKFASTIFGKTQFAMVVLRTFELLLSDVRAWWIPHINTISFQRMTEATYRMVISFHHCPEMTSFDHKMFLTDFILCCAPDAVIGHGMMKASTGEVAFSRLDEDDLVLKSKAEFMHRLFKIQGAQSIYKNLTETEVPVPLREDLDPRLKSDFKVISMVGWESRFKVLPTTFLDFLFPSIFYLDEEQDRSFGLISEWLLERGASKMYTFHLDTSKIPEIIAVTGTLVFGQKQVLGTTFLGCVLESVKNTALATEEESEKFIFTVFVDTEAPAEDIAKLSYLFDLMEVEPIDTNSRLLMDDLIDYDCAIPLEAPWVLQADLELQYNQTFTDLIRLSHYVGWIKPQHLQFMTMYNLQLRDFNPDPLRVYVAVPDYLAAQFLFFDEHVKSPFCNNQLLSLVYMITFDRDADNPDMVSICLHVLPDVDMNDINRTLEIRAHQLSFILDFGSSLERPLNLRISIGNKSADIRFTPDALPLFQSCTGEEAAQSSPPTYSFEKLNYQWPKKASLRAFRVSFSSVDVFSVFVHLISLLSNSYGGFWENHVIALRIRQSSIPDVWQCIWIIDDESMDIDERFSTILGRALFVCGSSLSGIEAGIFKTQSSNFMPKKNLDDVLEEYEEMLMAMLVYKIPKWLEDRNAKNASLSKAEADVKECQYLLETAKKTVEEKTLKLSEATEKVNQYSKPFELLTKELEVRASEVDEARKTAAKCEDVLELKIMCYEELQLRAEELSKRENDLQDQLNELIQTEAELIKKIETLTTHASQALNTQTEPLTVHGSNPEPNASACLVLTTVIHPTTVGPVHLALRLSSSYNQYNVSQRRRPSLFLCDLSFK